MANVLLNLHLLDLIFYFLVMFINRDDKIITLGYEHNTLLFQHTHTYTHIDINNKNIDNIFEV